MIILFDTETTGLAPKSKLVPLAQWPRVIEFACLLVEDGAVVEEYTTLIQPNCPIPPIITKITGLTAEDLVGAPQFAEILPRLRELFAYCEQGIGHNIQFDWDMIDSELRRLSIVDFPWPKQLTCTVQEFIHLKGRYLKQEELYQYFMNRPPAKAHRALDDVKALYECLCVAKFFEEVKVCPTCGGKVPSDTNLQHG